TALVIDIIGLPPPNQIDLEIATATLPLLSLPKIGADVDGFLLRSILADRPYTRLFVADDQLKQQRVVVKFSEARGRCGGRVARGFFTRGLDRITCAQPVRGRCVRTLPQSADRPLRGDALL